VINNNNRHISYAIPTSPILFNVYVDDLISLLQKCGLGCHVSSTFIGCIMYADDLLLLSPSARSMQTMVDTRCAFGDSHDIMFRILIKPYVWWLVLTEIMQQLYI